MDRTRGPITGCLVADIATAVFDPEGAVRLTLTVFGFHDRLAARDVPAIGDGWWPPHGRGLCHMGAPGFY